MQLTKIFLINRFVRTYGTYFCELFKTKKKIPSSWRYARNSNSRKFGFNSQRMQARFSLPQLPKVRPWKIIPLFSANVWRCPIYLHGRDSPGKVNSRLPRIECTLLIMKAILCKSQRISFLPEDENVCRVYAGTAGLPFANRQLLFYVLF